MTIPSIDAALDHLDACEVGRFWICQERKHGHRSVLGDMARETWYVHDATLGVASRGLTLDEAVAKALTRAKLAAAPAA